MIPPGRTLGLVASAAGGIERIRVEIVEPLLAENWQVAVTLTPTAGAWLRENGDANAIAETTGYPVRVESRLPSEKSDHPPVTCYAVVPASANTVAKLALGIADNQALTTVCEALGTRALPVVIFPRVNAAHARQPAWATHIEALHRVGADLVYGEDVWPLHEPRSAPGRDLPWDLIRQRIAAAASRG